MESIGRTPALLATKLSVPPVRPGQVVRQRLLERLNGSLDHRLTLVSAPAGFGKTTLLGEWIARAGVSAAGQDAVVPGSAPALLSVAWLSVDRADNDPPRFWRYVVAALQAAGVPIGQTLQSALQNPPPSIGPSFVTALVNDIAACPGPVVLVLDDYHLIEAEEIHGMLGFLLDHLPAHMHLVILTREDPPLALARRRARAELLEVRAGELRFTMPESAEFLRTCMGLDLAEEDVAALGRRTEGWIAGLQLAALSLRHQPDQHAFVAAFAGDDRYIMDYLVEEVLQQQPAHIQAFLLQTSILERLAAPLCDAVTGRSDSRAILAALEQANLFVVPLDNRREWYRYHYLFAELLQHRLASPGGNQVVAPLHRRASAWYEDNGFPAEAIHHALAAADFERAAALVEQHALPLIFRSEVAIPLAWIKALPEDVVRSRANLCIIHAWSLLLAHLASPEPVEQRLRDAEEALRACPSEDSLSGVVASHVAAIRAFMARVHHEAPQAAVDLSLQALDGLSEDNLRLRGFLTMNLASAYLRLGDADAAVRAFAEAQRIGDVNQDYYTALIAVHRQTYILNKQGRLREAARICRQALRTIAEPAEQRGRPIPAAGALYNALGAILLEWDDLEGAGSCLNKGLELLARTGERRVQVRGCATLARLKYAQGDIAAALGVLEQARSLWRGSDSYAAALQVRFSLARSEGDPAELAAAMQWAQERQDALADGEKAPSIYLEEDWGYAERLTLVRLLIAQRRAQAHPGGEPGLSSVLLFLARQLHLAAEAGWNERVIELVILQSLAQQAQGAMELALAALERALALAEPEGYARIFLDEGAPLVRLLYQAAERGIAQEYVGRLLAARAGFAAAEVGQPAAGGRQPALVEPLSQREIEILELIAAGLSNHEIAARLCITPGTVKVHTSHIYGKLGVHSRIQAVQRARKLGILAPG
jgi:LuxR family maltose regulon positive regulatory protein